MKLIELESILACKYPDEYRNLFGTLINNGRRIKLSLYNDEFWLITENDSTGLSLNNVEYILEEYERSYEYLKVKDNADKILPFARSANSDGQYYLLYKLERNFVLTYGYRYEIWLGNIDSFGTSYKVADKITGLIDPTSDKEEGNEIIFYEHKTFSDYLNWLPLRYNSPENASPDEFHISVTESNENDNWQYETYCKLTKLELGNGTTLYSEEITAEHVIQVANHKIHFTAVITYIDGLNKFWFQEPYFFDYGARSNHYSDDFYKRLEVIIISLNSLLRELSIAQPDIDQKRLIKLIDNYEIRQLVNKSHLEIELLIP